MANRRHIWNGSGTVAPFGIQEGDHYKDNVTGKMYLYTGSVFIETADATLLRDRATHTGTQSLSSISQSSATSGQVPMWTSSGWVPTTPVGAGDMLISIYDTNNDGIVDNASKLGLQLPEYYLNRNNHTGTQNVSSIVGLADIATTGSGNDLVAGSIGLSKLTDITYGTILGRVTAGSGSIENLDSTQVKQILSLNNVNNTADANKPVSSFQQTALDAKIDTYALFNTSATGNYTLLQSDNTKTLVLDNTVTSIIVAAGLNAGTQIQLFNAKGAAIPLTTTGVTARGKGSNVAISDDSYVCITYQTSGIVLISGKME